MAFGFYPGSDEYPGVDQYPGVPDTVIDGDIVVTSSFGGGLTRAVSLTGGVTTTATFTGGLERAATISTTTAGVASFGGLLSRQVTVTGALTVSASFGGGLDVFRAEEITGALVATATHGGGITSSAALSASLTGVPVFGGSFALGSDITAQTVVVAVSGGFLFDAAPPKIPRRRTLTSTPWTLTGQADHRLTAVTPRRTLEKA